MRCHECKYYVGNNTKYFGVQCLKSKEEYKGHSNYTEIPQCKYHPNLYRLDLFQPRLDDEEV